MLKSFPDRNQIPLLGFEKESTLPALYSITVTPMPSLLHSSQLHVQAK
jgi:hypothetical protein